MSCSDILLEDISKNKIELIAPNDSSAFNSNEISFVWKHLEGAENYELLLLKDGVVEIFDIRNDSLQQATINITTILSAGNYQWKVIAYNSEFDSESELRNLVIDTLSNIEEVSVELLLPFDKTFYNNSLVNFSWSIVEIADDYRFDLRKNSINGELITSQIVETNNITFNITENGNYYWGIQANKQFQASSDFSFNELNIDTIEPSQPQLVTPAPNSIISSFPVEFSWDKSQDFSFSTEYDSLYIHENNGVDTVLISNFKIENNLDYTLDTIYDGNFIWDVQSFDAANNKSIRSSSNSFTVKYE